LDWNRIESGWTQHYKATIKQQWGRLTDTQLDQIAGNREHLAVQIQESYGVTKKEAGKQLYDWQKLQKA
jgi:uncharacterized protein YjbJ (UPF0337 family)